MDSFTESWVQVDRFAREHPELSAEDIRAMPVNELARLTGWQTPPTLTHVPAEPVTAPTAVTAPSGATPEPVSVRAMTHAEYAAYRQQIGMGKSTSARGIFDQR